MIASSRAFSCIILAMRKTYLPLSFAGILRQTVSYAFFAALTARSTSFSFPSATSLSFSSVAGLIVLKYFPEEGFFHSPLIKWLYCGAMLAALLLSGAGAYVHSVSNLSLTVLLVFAFFFLVAAINFF